MKKNNKYLMFSISISMLLSCSGDAFVDDINLKFCGKCANTGRWTIDSLDFNPCYSTKAECLDYAAKNGYSDKGCVLCN